MTRLRNAAAAVAALLGPLLLLSGCGIKPTGVVESGAAANVVVNSPDRAGVVYFVTPDDKLVPSPQVDSTLPSPVGTVLRLLAGPGPQERAAGLGTRLPGWDGTAPGSVSVSFTSPQSVEVKVPFMVLDLPELAMRQLVCTVASVVGSEIPDVRVTLRGPGTTLFGERCDIGR
ncbi:hypothetical protein ACFWTC_12160 [Streptomyces sp. NPDC058619]|uniref:hypothetical protein n=1 Tax=unclassified Streptomyces TaxID=2593676 RepID=UPI003656C005